MIPVNGRRVMDYLVDRMRAAEAGEIRLVTRPDKDDVASHARALGLRVILAAPQTAAESVAAGSAGLADDDVVLLGFPDTIWEPVDGFTRLLPQLTGSLAAVLGLFRTVDLRRSDVVCVDDGGLVREVAVKPDRPSSEWIWGCAAVRAWALAELTGADDLGRGFDALARRGLVAATSLSDQWVDIGTSEGLRRASANGNDPGDRNAQALA